MKVPRKIWASLLILAALPVGFALGGWTGARLLVPENVGLAGGAMVFWYGVLGMLLVLVAAVVAIRTLGATGLKRASLTTAVLGSGVLVVLGLAVSDAQRESETHRQLAMARLPPFELLLVGNIGDELHRFAYASEENELRVRLADDRQCGGSLPAGKSGDQSRVELLSALRGLDVAGVLVEPPACQQVGEVLATLEIEIRETKPPATAGSLQLTRACRDSYRAIDALFQSVLAVYRRHERDLLCR